jgi:hypothetical protein
LSNDELVEWYVKLGQFLPVGDMKSNGKRKRVLVDTLQTVMKAADESELQQLISANFDTNWRLIKVPRQVP